MTDSENLEGQTKLNITSLVGDGYRSLFTKFTFFLKVMWITTLVSGLLNWRMYAQYPELLETSSINDATSEAATNTFLLMWGEPLTYVYMILSWLVLVGAMIAVQRSVLLGEAAPRPLGISVGMRELRYFGYCVAAYFLSMAPLLIFAVAMPLMAGLESALGAPGGTAFTGLLGLLALLVISGYMFIIPIRLSLAMPAIAVDAEGGLGKRFGHAWAIAKGNTFRLSVAIFVAILPLLIISGLGMTYFMPVMGQDSVDTASSGLLTMITMFATTITLYVVSVMFARAYQILTLSLPTQEPLVESG